MLYSCEDPECPEREHICPLPSNNRLAAERYVVEDIGSGEQHPVVGENTLLDNGNEGGPSELKRSQPVGAGGHRLKRGILHVLSQLAYGQLRFRR